MSGAGRPGLEAVERAWRIADTLKLRAEVAVYEEELLEKRHDRLVRETQASARRVYDFVGEVTEYDVQTAVDELNDWVNRSSAPITIRLCSPGGSVFDGYFLFDFIQEIRRSGVQVTTKGLGYIASMASILLQAGDRRLIGRNAWFMVHEPSSMALGKASEMKDEANLLVKLHRQGIDILAERSSLNVKQLLARCNRKDWWMPAVEAVKFGFADELV